MRSFLITFKPAAESPQRGWPLKELQKLVRRCQAGQRPVEPWRFHNRKGVALGDRVFLLLQGKTGPAIIGYGSVAGGPEKIDGELYFPVQFESLVDPTNELLANKVDLFAIEGARSVWRTRASGVLLKKPLATHLEASIVGNSPKPTSGESATNPDWTRDELILALNFYLQHRPNPPGKDSQEIRALSTMVKRLGKRLIPAANPTGTFRNENGVYMKLMNFRRLDPQYTVNGRTGLGRGARAEEEVWAAVAQDPFRCQQVAEAIVRTLDDPEAELIWLGPDIDDGVQEAAEGRVLTRKHLVRERSRKLVESKLKQAMKKHGRLICEACDFDFVIHYGNRGIGFIECHHTKPVTTLTEGATTHIDDLALVCANCHRMIHRGEPWLAIADLRALLDDARRKITSSYSVRTESR
jgi:5-methylcytosine-specific restriction protein A